MCSLPCRLQPHKCPSARGDRAYHQPRSCGDDSRSFLLLACSSAHRGSQLSEIQFHFRIKPSSLDSFPHLTPIFDAHYMVLQTHKHHNFYFASDLHNMGATCSVSPGSRCHRTGCTALHGNPWLPPDSPECNNKRQQRSQRTNK